MIKYRKDYKYVCSTEGTEQILPTNESDVTSLSPVMDITYGKGGELLEDQHFTYRQTAGGEVSDIPENVATVQAIRGQSVVWNQKVNEDTSVGFNGGGITGTFSNGVWTYSGTPTKAGIALLPRGCWGKGVANHKYYANMIGEHNSNGGLVWIFYSTGGNERIDGRKGILTLTRDSNDIEPVASLLSTSGEFTASLAYTLIDLTLMFGAGNEPETVEEFEAWLAANVGLRDYYPYNAGTILNVKSTGIKTTGFNQWDEEWEVGTLAYGLPTYSTVAIRSKNFCNILPNTTYYMTCGKTDGGNENVYYILIAFYDADKQFISRLYSNRREFTTPANAAYFKVATNTNTVVYGSTYNHDICINISDTSKNGTYEPYFESTSPMEVTTMKGKLNGQGISTVVFPYGMNRIGNIYDEVYVDNGVLKAVKRLGVVDLGTLTWSLNGNYFITTSLIYGSSDSGNSICTIYAVKDLTSLSVNNDKTIGIANLTMYVRDTSYLDANTFKTAMNGVMLVYELATPQEYIVDVHKDLTRRIINAHIDLKYNYYKGGTEEVLSSDSNSVSPIIKLDYNGVELTDQEFTLRKTGNDLVNDNDVCLIENIKGNSLAWNQLQNYATDSTSNGIRINGNGNGTIVITVENPTGNKQVQIIQSTNIVVGHKYYVYGSDRNNGIEVYFGSHSSPYTSSYIMTTTTSASLLLFVTSSVANGTYTKTVLCIDLTLIYGAGNEPSTAEAFEADYQRWFGRPLTYEPYDAGSIRDCKMQQIVSRGFNQWDEEWEVGDYLADGTKGTRTDRIRCKNLIPVMPSTTYFIKSPVGFNVLNYYSSDKTIIRSAGGANYMMTTITTPENCCYIAFHLYGSYGTTYNHDICINLDDANKNGTYEAYKESDLYLDVTQLKGKVNGQGDDVVMFPTGLHSAGNVHDEINLATGTAIKRVGVVDLGTQNINRATSNGQYFFAFPLSGTTLPSTGIERTKGLLCGLYVANGYTIDTNSPNKSIRKYENASVYIRDDSYSDTATFKTAMSGVMLYYELATPIEYQLDVHDVQQVYVGNDLVWEKPVQE